MRRKPVPCLCTAEPMLYRAVAFRQWWVCCTKLACRVGPRASSRIAAIRAWDYMIARAKEATERKKEEGK